MRIRRPKSFEFFGDDYILISSAIAKLPLTQQRIVYLRFWKKYDSVCIAYLLNLNLSGVEFYLKDSYQRIKLYCMSHPDFIRGGHSPDLQLAVA